MTAKTRYFVITSLLVMTAGVGTGLVAYYVGFPAHAIAGPGGPAELKYVPRDATVVAYADVNAVMGSELRQHVKSAFPAADAAQNGQREFESETGINIETDIDRVVFSLDANAAGDGSSAVLVLANGRFDEVKIESLMREHGATVEQYKGKRIIVATPPAPSGDTPAVGAGSPDGRGPNVRKVGDFAVSFLKPGLAAVGSVKLIRTAADLENGGESVTTNDTVMNLVRSMDSGNAWAVGRLDALREKAQLPNGMNQLPAITWFSASGHVNSGIDGVVRAEARDDESANSLREVIRGFIALGRLQAGAKPELQAMLQSLELGGAGRTVALSFSVPANAIDSLVPTDTNKRPRPRAR